MNADAIAGFPSDADGAVAPAVTVPPSDLLQIGITIAPVMCMPVHSPRPMAGALALELDARDRGVAGPAGSLAGLVRREGEWPHHADLFSVRIETKDPGALRGALAEVQGDTTLHALDETVFAAHLTGSAIQSLASHPAVDRLYPKVQSHPRLIAANRDIGLWRGSRRVVPETGEGVLLGVVDTGFDLTHPMFRDEAGSLRVVALLDQKEGRTYDRQELETGWKDGSRPGADENGHGTHVASICGGSRAGNYEGVAPGAEFMLVRSNQHDTDQAVQWIFAQAGERACVVNLSLGHHWGAHDGSDVEERLFAKLSGPGKIIVVAAGNEQTDALHISALLGAGQEETIWFDVLLREDENGAYAGLTLWYDANDRFEFSIIDPAGRRHVPNPLSNASRALGDILRFAREDHPQTGSVELQVTIIPKPSDGVSLEGWKLSVRCVHAAGEQAQLDGWFHDAGYARFRDHSFVCPAGTIGLPGTGEGSVSVGSYVTRTRWLGKPVQAGAGGRGRSSVFTSLGPTRDQRLKPEISAPGEYVAAALASNSLYSRFKERVMRRHRLVVAAGTSMAAPVVSGTVALMLQCEPALDVERVRGILIRTARHDRHTGCANWNPAFGYGKIDVAAAVAALRPGGVEPAV